MESFRDLLEAKTIKVFIGDLQDRYGEPEQEFDDFHYFLQELRQYGLKEKDWNYADDDVIEIPAKYLKYTKPWDVNVK